MSKSCDDGILHALLTVLPHVLAPLTIQFSLDVVSFQGLDLLELLNEHESTMVLVCSLVQIPQKDHLLNPLAEARSHQFSVPDLQDSPRPYQSLNGRGCSVVP